MPEGFNRCQAKGGRIRTKPLGKGRYMHICFADGQSFAGEPKTKKGHQEMMRGRKKPKTG